jgi:putative membrane protein
MNLSFTRLILLTAVLALSFGSILYAAEPGSEADKVFVGKVSQGGAYEVEASKVAEQKATAPDVKDLAAMEVHDHILVNSELKKIAADTGIPVDSSLNATFQQRLEKLNNVPAAEFDAAYVADMQQIHDTDQKLFAKEAMDGSNAFKTFAHQTDLIVKRHIGALHGLDAK